MKRRRRAKTETDWQAFIAYVAKGIREERAVRGWRQEDLARHAGLHRAQVARLEQALACDLRVVWTIARALGYRVGALLP